MIDNLNTVSICIPAYGEPEKLRRCIDSVLRQTYSKYEIIITDDSRDDFVETVIRGYFPNDKIRYYRNPATKGSPENWNEAMRKALGDSIILMHHDDWFYAANTLEILVNRMLTESADMVFARSYNINSLMEIISINDPAEEAVQSLNTDIQKLFYANRIGAPSAVLFKNKGVFFDTRLKWLVDVEFYIRFLRGRSLSYAREAIVGIGISASQMTRSCLGNLDVEIGENLLVFGTLRHSWMHFASDFRHFSRLFAEFELKRKEFKKFHAESRIRLIYSVYSFWKPIKKILKKILRKA
jgi:glycosyltransferase involved in cell wall biosynthesis